jgi:hypothetical protein
MRRAIQLLSVCMLAVAMSCAANAKENGDDEKEGKEANEVTVKFDQLPQVVQTTFKEEARGATIAEVDKETEDGEIAYEADVEIKGKKYEIKVAEDGTLISKKLDKEDDGDKDEAGDDDDKKPATGAAAEKK